MLIKRSVSSPDDVQAFKEADRIGRLKMHMMNDRFVLSPIEEDYLATLTTVWTTMTERITQTGVQKQLNKLMPNKVYRLPKLIADAQALFGDLMKVNKDFERGIQRERIKRHIEKLENDEPKGFMDSIAKFEGLLMKLDGLDKDEQDKGFDWSKLSIPVPVFSNNAKFLADNAEDLEIIVESNEEE